jgi:hypothetical protein
VPLRFALRSAALAIAAAFVVSLPVPSSRAADPDPLIHGLRTDPSFKVRLQAARILVRRLEGARAPSAPEVIEAFRAAARADESAIVRAFAVRALGDLAGPRQGALFDELAATDPDPFVREQAEAARAVWAARAAKAPILVVAADPWRPEPAVDRTEELRETLRLQTEELAGPHYRVGPPGDGRGFLLRATASDLETRSEADREVVTLQLRLALATWPGKNLRQVVTARASAKVAPSYARRDRLRRQLLENAMKRAVSDALAHLEGG